MTPFMDMYEYLWPMCWADYRYYSFECKVDRFVEKLINNEL